MSPKDEAEIRRIIMERRARFVAAAVAATGLTACGAKSSDGAEGRADNQTENTAGMNTVGPNPTASPFPTVCLSVLPSTPYPQPNPSFTVPAPTACLSPLMPTVTAGPPPTAGPTATVGPTVTPAPTVCLSIAQPFPDPEPPIETEPQSEAGAAIDAGSSVEEGAGLDAGANAGDPDAGGSGTGGNPGL